jgi:tetratricopeptide (TPR) repeat protein
VGRPGEALPIFEGAIRLARELDDTEMLGFLHGEATWAYFFLGDARNAVSYGRQAVEIAERVGSSMQRAHAASVHGMALAASGDWSGASAEGERIRAIAAESGVALEWQLLALFILSAARLGQGDPESAREMGREAVRLAREHGVALGEVPSLYYLMRALLRPEASPELDEAEAVLSEAMERLRATSTYAWEPLLREQAAEIARLRGDLPLRERELREAHRLFVEMGATGHAERLARELGP